MDNYKIKNTAEPYESSMLHLREKNERTKPTSARNLRTMSKLTWGMPSTKQHDCLKDQIYIHAYIHIHMYIQIFEHIYIFKLPSFCK